MYSIRINPRLLKLIDSRNLGVKKKFLTNSQGIHRSNKKGYGLEFADYRQYELGDDPRHIDWSVYSRSEKIVVKTFQEELSVHFQIIIDSTKSMQIFSKLEKALELVGLISYLALDQNDSVQILLSGRGSTPKIKSLKSFYSLTNLDKLNWKKNNIDFIDETKKAINLSQFPCVVILISDFMYELDELNKLLKYCNSRRFELFCLQVLSKNEIQPEFNGDLLDNETQEKTPFSNQMIGEYSKIFNQHINILKDILKKNNSGFAQFVSEESSEENLVSQLKKLGLLR